jgi:hypothetical protein
MCPFQRDGETHVRARDVAQLGEGGRDNEPVVVTVSTPRTCNAHRAHHAAVRREECAHAAESDRHSASRSEKSVYMLHARY